MVLLRGPWLQASARAACLAGGQTLALPSLAHSGHRPPRPRRGAQATRHLVLHVADRAARAGPRAHLPHGGTRPRAVLAPGPAARGVGRAVRLHLIAVAQRPARGESGGPAAEPCWSCPFVGPPEHAGTSDLPPPIVARRRPENKGTGP